MFLCCVVFCSVVLGPDRGAIEAVFWLCFKLWFLFMVFVLCSALCSVVFLSCHLRISKRSSKGVLKENALVLKRF